jgi:hypothetical protein
MSLYPESIARCQQIKVNGTQCASPALRRQKFCYFHKQYREKRLEINSNIQRERWKITLPMLEDANSIQMGLVQVMRLLVMQQIDHRTAGLMLYALQTASANLKRTSFEPEPTHVVIDRGCVQRRPMGATAWSTIEGREYDDIYKDDMSKKDGKEKAAAEDEDLDEPDDPDLAPDSPLMYLYETRKAHEPWFRDERIENALAHQKQIAEKRAARDALRDRQGARP